MKVLVLIYGDEEKWEALTPGEADEVHEHHRAFAAVAAAKIVTGAELAPTQAATTVRVRDGQTVVTDGPFLETKEVLGGYFMADCNDLDQAIELARRVPLVDRGSVEIRPVVEN